MVMAIATGALLGTVVFSLDGRVDADVLGLHRVSSPPLPADVVRDRARGAVLQADVVACGGRRQGTVTVVDLGRGPVGLTNAHVVEGAEAVQLDGPGVMADEGTVKGFVPHRDAAVVDLAGARPAEVLRPGAMPATGDAVVVAGYPVGEFHEASGTVQRVEDRTGRGGTSPVMLVDVEAVPGVSGGVVVDRFGRAVGLVAARDPDTGWAVAYPISEVLAEPRPAAPSC
jgi:hypothetical protein